MKLLFRRLKEWCLFDFRLAKLSLSIGLLAVATWKSLRGNRLGGWLVLFRLHRAALSTYADNKIAASIRSAMLRGEFHAVLAQYVRDSKAPSQSTGLLKDTSGLLGPHATVLKTAQRGEKGVLLLNYSHVYALFAKFFDLDQIAARYHIVLEPSWSGACDENILVYSSLLSPVFVETSEPRDLYFLKQLQSTLVGVPLAANWWIDHSTYCPRPGIDKDSDIVMVASWSRMKRHAEVFRALRTLRRRGKRLRALLAGYPIDMTLSDIRAVAAHFGVADQIELFEWISPEEVSRLMNRAKVNLIWSRREGSNRAVIEGLFSGTPAIMRKGFNYGHHHDYINVQTGKYSDDAELPAVLELMVDSYETYSTREWAMSHMTYEMATSILERHIGDVARERGEHWSGGLVPHFSSLHGNHYLETADMERFGDDYDFIAKARRR